jgi:uncharacterized protein (TIGR00730 family)
MHRCSRSLTIIRQPSALPEGARWKDFAILAVRTVSMRVGVFCGSRQTADGSYQRVAAELGSTLANSGIVLVYGGSSKGLMGALAEGALQSGGTVIGVMPQFLIDREEPRNGLTEFRITQTLAQRKSILVDLSDAFIVLPGGFGTLDEMFEVLTTAQVSLHSKPCILLNVGHFFQHLVHFIDQAVHEGLIHPRHRALLTEATTAVDAVDRAMELAGYDK